MKRVLSILCIVMVIALLAGCSAKMEEEGGTISSEESGLKATGNNDETANNSEEGEETVSPMVDVELPEGFPIDVVPIYEPYEFSTIGSTDTYYDINFWTKKTPKEVNEFYAGKLDNLEQGLVDDFEGCYYDNGTIGNWIVRVSMSTDDAEGGMTIVSLFVGEPE